MSLERGLADGIQALQVMVAAEAQRRMLDYLALVEKWNKAYNLTAVREQDRMLTHHVLDSLSTLPHVRGGYILDVGSGAGLPGIPLALARPDWQITLLDSSHKKAAFLRQAVIELKLDNVDVVCMRVENWKPPRQFDTVISRAFSDLPEYLSLAGKFCMKTGLVLAMKGIYPHEELAQLPREFRLCDVVPLHVPGLDAQRHAVLLQPV